jgi:hypothetical protein
MKNAILLLAFAAIACSFQGQAQGQQRQRYIERALKHDMQNKGDVWAQKFANQRPWHDQYYYTQYGQPTALVVPPTAVMHQTNSWGVSRNYSLPIYHQFGYQGTPSAGGAFYATPVWPSNTQQFGVYPVRGPW